ncbi:hypothetical protein GIX45_08030 [Erwinia sp. CPCC 100877]|nr:hypothetical protein [Erwinia sp. CPCC 100877]
MSQNKIKIFSNLMMQFVSEGDPNLICLHHIFRFSLVYLLKNKSAVESYIEIMQKKGQVDEFLLFNQAEIQFQVVAEETKELQQQLGENLKNDLEVLNELDSCFLIIDFGTGSVKKVKIVSKSNSKGIPNKSEQNSRAFELIHYEQLFKNYHNTQMPILNHRFIELRSSYIPAYGTEFQVRKDYIESGFGRAYTDKNAQILSSIEAFERYCNIYDRRNRLTVKSSYQNLALKSEVLNPKQLILHSEKELINPCFSLSPYSPELEIEWVVGESTTSSGKNKLFVPKNSIVFGERKENEQSGSNFVFDTSNGMAIGGSLAEAKLYGLYELIERDAFLSAWYGKAQLNEIKLEDFDLKEFQELKIVLNRKKQEIKLFDITSEVEIPTVWAIIIDTSSDAPMKIYNAAAANLSLKKAVENALFEVCTTFPIYESLLSSTSELSKRRDKVIESSHHVVEMQDHILYYATEKNIHEFDFILNKPSNVYLQRKIDKLSFSSLEEELHYVEKQVLGKFQQIINVDLTPDFLKNEDLYASRVIVPGMLPMTFGEQYRRIDSQRVKRYLAFHQQTYHGINNAPHPFP